jgi:hypothetical protein
VGRRFRHLDEEWDAESTELAGGSGAGNKVPVTDHEVEFTCVSNPSKGPYREDIPKQNPNDVSEEVLKRALERAVARVIHTYLTEVFRPPRRVSEGTYRSDYREWWFYLNEGERGVVAIEREIFNALPRDPHEARRLLRLSELAAASAPGKKVLITGGGVKIDSLPKQ